MNRDQFWLTEDQFSRLAPLLPTDTRGKPRVDDRRVISGIVHVLKSGGRWVDAPDVYGPYKTLYNRFVRWAAKGIWVDIFDILGSAGGPPAQVLIDSSHLAAKGGMQSGHWPITRWTHHQNPRSDRQCVPSYRLHPDWRSGRRLHRRRSPASANAARIRASWRQRL